MKKIEKAFIESIEYPDWDYVINQLLHLAYKINEVIEETERLYRLTLPVVNLDDENKNCKNCGHEHDAKKACQCRCIDFRNLQK